MVKINYKTIDVDRNELDIDSFNPYNDKTIKFVMKSDNAHNLNVGDEIVMSKYYDNNGIKTLICKDVYKVNEIIDDLTFNILMIDNFSCNIINQSSSIDKTRDVVFDNNHGITPTDISNYINDGNIMKLYVNSGTTDAIELTNIKNINVYNEYYEHNSIYDASKLVYNTLRVLVSDNKDIRNGRVYFPFTRYYFYSKKKSKYVLFDNVEITRNVSFYTIPLILEVNGDYERLMQERVVIENYINTIKEDLIPEPYNMERVKYKPRSVNGEYVEGLVFNFHFRERESINGGKEPTKDWYVAENSTKYWNTIKSLTDIKNDSKYIGKSDLLGYLGFTLEDVVNQKNCIKKSFIRLSFYNSKDPLTQKLLFYSTIFMDSGKLYGKYLKCLKFAKKGNTEVSVFEENEDENLRLSSQIIVYDEFNTSSSSEGYNLYLFEDDVPSKNRERDIYLKVEFNHAGYGRTIPMMLWDKEKLANGLTIDNYLENLYITIRIKYNNKGYTYSVPDVINDNNLLTFNLFEPRFEKTNN